MLRFKAVIYGKTQFPEHPDREGAWGLVGGEDCTTSRETFTSAGAAMTWCRRVLDGQVKPRRVEWAGEVLTPNTGLTWVDARVLLLNGDDDERYVWVSVGRQWFEETESGVRGDLARDDDVYFGTKA